MERAPAPLPARRQEPGRGQPPRTPGSAQPAAPAAAAAARPLRPLLGARRHQAEARQHPEDRARGHRAAGERREGAGRARRGPRVVPPGHGAGGRRAPEDARRDAGVPRRPHPGPAELRVHGSRRAPHVLGADEGPPAADAAAVPLQHAESTRQHDAPGPRADAGDDAGPQPHAPGPGRGTRAGLRRLQAEVGRPLPGRPEPRPAPGADRPAGRPDAVAALEHVARTAQPAPGHDAVALHAGRAARGRAAPARHEPLPAHAAARRPALQLPRQRRSHHEAGHGPDGRAPAAGRARAADPEGARPQRPGEDRPRSRSSSSWARRPLATSSACAR